MNVSLVPSTFRSLQKVGSQESDKEPKESKMSLRSLLDPRTSSYFLYGFRTRGAGTEIGVVVMKEKFFKLSAFLESCHVVKSFT